ncbi:MAG: hypothetical protein WCH42_06790 [Actinomycetes bacterium]
MTKPLMILISGPYMSGTNGDEEAIARNLKAMEGYALPIFEKGHVAVVGEWLAWPVIRQSGGNSHSSAQFSEYQYPIAHRLLEKCDAVLRIPGESRGADIEMGKAREMGKMIFTSLEEIPSLVSGLKGDSSS